MLTCNCNLCYENPKACLTCNNYLKELGEEWNHSEWYKEIIKNKLYFIKTPEFNSDRYELVEKKDWKIKDLEKRIEHTKKVFRSNSDEITKLQKLENEYAKELTILEKELKELKNNK